MDAKFPVVGVGAVVIHDDRVLLIKRGKPPNQHQWAIPGGKVKPGETLQQAAEREIYEETGIKIRAGKSVFTFEHIEHSEDGRLRAHYVVTDLLAEYVSGEIRAQSDAAEAKWFSRHELKITGGINATTRKLLHEISYL